MNPVTSASAQEVEALEREIHEKAQRLGELKRALPRERVQDYTLAGPNGPVKLSELFDGKKDLIVVHNMGKGCRYCTLWADGFNGVWRHLSNRAGFAVCSPDAPDVQKAFAESRQWGFRMVSGQGSTFTEDLGFRGEKSWTPGVSTFRLADDGTIERVAKAVFGPYDLYCGVWHLIGMLADGENGWEPKYVY